MGMGLSHPHVRACPRHGKRIGVLTASGERPSPANPTASAKDIPGIYAKNALVLLKPVSVSFPSLAAKQRKSVVPKLFDSEAGAIYGSFLI